MSDFKVEHILDSIPSGFLCIMCDSLNVVYISKRAREILYITDSDGQNHEITEILKIENEQLQLFISWIKVAIRLYNSQDWSKIHAIVPVKNLRIQKENGSEITELEVIYYPLSIDNKKLIGILIETIPKTETESIIHNTSQAVIQRENEVKAILSIANTPLDEMSDFIVDTTERLNNLGTSTGELEDIYKSLRSDYENSSKSSSTAISERLQSIYIDTVFRHLHTIKGNALTYEFEELTQFAHDAESLANQLRHPVMVRRADVVKSIKQLIKSMITSFEFIISIFEKIYGNDEERTVRLPLERIVSIHSLCAELESKPMSSSIARLVNECRTLSWKTLGSLTRKYGRVIYSRAVKLGKQIEFIVENSYTLVEPEIFKSLDDTLIQIVSNAVVHGIEDNETRCLKQKGSGHIRLSYHQSKENVVVTIADDGQGIRTDLLVEQFINKGKFTRDDAEKMSEEEKVHLIFIPRSSTAATVTTFAGRGVGMDVVDNKIKSLGGSIKVTTEAGKGTKFVITIPFTGKDQNYE